jgi:CheY-like chemotaxis protein
MIETTATVIMIVSERVGLHREEHALLLRNGYSVTEAQYGMDALLKLRDSRPDLIVLDHDMAAGRWLDICRDIRSEHLRFEDRTQGSNIHWRKDHDR